VRENDRSTATPINLAQRRKGAELMDVYEFGSYQTAWAWLHKLRSVMIGQGRELLSKLRSLSSLIISTHRGMLFYRLVQQSVTTRPLSTKDLYSPKTLDVGGT